MDLLKGVDDEFQIVLNPNDSFGTKILGIGIDQEISSNTIQDVALFDDESLNNEYWFSMLTYDLKNAFEELESNNQDHLSFPLFSFISPKLICFWKDDELEIHFSEKGKSLLEKIESKLENSNQPEWISESITTNWKHRFSKEEYILRANSILEEIARGNIFEVNFCQEFYLEKEIIDPYASFQKLNDATIAPFASFVKLREHYALCASPERYLKKTSTEIISQPIKGTAKRGESKEEDLMLVSHLMNDPKERSENIMIVDLVRNDLSRVCVSGSVEVENLCEIYSFKTVHQMISTVKGEVEKDKGFMEIVKATFPMGSMTGAPKIRAMKIAEKMEVATRGLYSGSIGLIYPNGDFDLNVVIRTVLYNEKNHYLSASVGSALTINAIPENEYEECLVKVEALLNCLQK